MAQRVRHLQRKPDTLNSIPRTEVEGKGDTIRTNTYTFPSPNTSDDEDEDDGDDTIATIT